MLKLEECGFDEETYKLILFAIKLFKAQKVTVQDIKK